MVQFSAEGVVCRKCGRLMYIVSESERFSDSSKRISYYYKCPSCGYRVDLEQINIIASSDLIIVRRRINLHNKQG